MYVHVYIHKYVYTSIYIYIYLYMYDNTGISFYQTITNHRSSWPWGGDSPHTISKQNSDGNLYLRSSHYIHIHSHTVFMFIFTSVFIP